MRQPNWPKTVNKCRHQNNRKHWRKSQERGTEKEAVTEHNTSKGTDKQTTAARDAQQNTYVYAALAM